MRSDMPAEIVNLNNAEHYVWGEICDAWHLVKNADLSVIRESMPPGASEQRHLHRVSRQFFYVLQGELSMEVEQHDYLLRAGEGIEVSPGQAHKVFNRASEPLSFIAISQPPSHGDRVPA